MEEVTLRKFPYPFKAGLAICSDIDGTDTVEKFLAIQEFLNTGCDTDMGPGIGLEIGNSFFPLTPDDTFSYLSSRPRDRAIIRDLIQAGYIDCLHSYGEGARSREDALRVLDALEKDGCRVEVWVDHTRAPTNLGTDNTFGRGTEAGSPVYHADVTLAYGIRFAWIGRSTTIAGQDTPITIRALARALDLSHIRGTGNNLARELAKIVSAWAGNPRFGIHRSNRLFRAVELQDGQQIYEFIRFTNHWHNPSVPDGAGLGYMLRRQVLEELKTSKGCMIVYTHLGAGNYSPLLPAASQSALRNLASEYRAGEVYVTTTARLLTYCLTHRYLDWSYSRKPDNWVEITIHRIADPLFGPRPPTMEDLQGITFYVPERHRASIFLGHGDGAPTGNRQISHLERNPGDHTGRDSVMIPRTFLTYPLNSDDRP